MGDEGFDGLGHDAVVLGRVKAVAVGVVDEFLDLGVFLYMWNKNRMLERSGDLHTLVVLLGVTEAKSLVLVVDRYLPDRDVR